MKLLFLTHNYPRFDGDYSGFFLKELAEGLIKKGLEITIVAPHFKNTKLFEDYGSLKIIRFRYSNDENIAYTGKMHHFIKNPLNWNKFFSFFFNFYLNSKDLSQQYNILHSHWLIPAGIIGKFLKFDKKIISLHGTDIRLIDSLKIHRFGKYFLDSYNYILPVSKYLKKTITSWKVRSNIKTMPITGNLDEFISKPLRNIPDNISLITVSRLSKQKNIQVVLKAIKIIKSKGIEINYSIVGDGEEKENLISLCKNLNISDNVKFYGKIPHSEIPEIIDKHSIFILPSVNEGFGLSILEARLSGRIVIGSESGGITDLIIDKKTGYFFNHICENDCAEKILNIINNKSSSLKIAENSYKDAIKNFSFKSQVNRWFDFYQNLK